MATPQTMIYCQKCGKESSAESTICTDCGSDLQPQPNHSALSTFFVAISSWWSRLLSFLYDFFTFRFMVTTHLIEVVYVTGAWAMTVGGLIQISSIVYAVNENGYGWAFGEGRQTLVLWFVLGVLSILVGNLFWRLFCELWILFFNIHDELVLINKSRKT